MFLTHPLASLYAGRSAPPAIIWVQVQDVGLIFLSAMATAIAHDGLSKGVPKAEILGTTLATITVSTFIVGLLIILVGAPCPTASSCPPLQRLDRAFATGVQLADHALNLRVLRAGQFRLASLVQYVPLPVVGGYLGYVSPSVAFVALTDILQPDKHLCR